MNTYANAAWVVTRPAWHVIVAISRYADGMASELTDNLTFPPMSMFEREPMRA